MRGLVLSLVLCLWMTSSPARASADVGVVVVGESTMQPQLAAQLDSWLRKHGHQVVAAPLAPDAINTIIDCFVVEDEPCARKVVEKRSKAQSVVYARVDLQPGGAANERTVAVTIYWFEKGKDAIAERRFCERCTDLTLRSTADAAISALAGATIKDVGRLKLTSSPRGARVSVDGKPVGVTPIEYDLAPGDHQVTLSHDSGSTQRDVVIRRGETTLVDVALDDGGSTRLLPKLLVGGGAALLVTGVVLFAIDEDEPAPVGPQDEFYRNSAPAGVGLALTGAVVGGIGAYLWLSSRSKGAPVAAVSSHSGFIGWAGQF